VVERQLTGRLHGTVRLHIVYDGGQGVLRELLGVCGRRKWHIYELDSAPLDVERGQAGVTGCQDRGRNRRARRSRRVGTVLQAANEPE
jgi:hypothetical protein